MRGAAGRLMPTGWSEARSAFCEGPGEPELRARRLGDAGNQVTRSSSLSSSPPGTIVSGTRTRLA
jgi:hypothetical protein